MSNYGNYIEKCHSNILIFSLNTDEAMKEYARQIRDKNEIKKAIMVLEKSSKKLVDVCANSTELRMKYQVHIKNRFANLQENYY